MVVARAQWSGVGGRPGVLPVSPSRIRPFTFAPDVYTGDQENERLRPVPAPMMSGGKLSSQTTSDDGVSLLSRLIEDYIAELREHREKATWSTADRQLRIFREWAERNGYGRTALLSGPHDQAGGVFSKDRLKEFKESLSDARRVAAGKRPLEASTRNRYLEVALRLWEWAEHDDKWCVQVTRGAPPSFPKLQVVEDDVVAPTWAEMDAAISELQPRSYDDRDTVRRLAAHQHLAIVLRYTGLRVGQALRLEWRDFDFGRGLLRFRGELGKSAAEKKGRTVPVCAHLLAHLAPLRGPPEGRVVPHIRSPQHVLMREAWRLARTPEECWKRRPFHGFRKGFESGLISASSAAGIANSADAIEALVGHRLKGMKEVYVQKSVYPLSAVVALVPAIVYRPPSPRPELLDLVMLLFRGLRIQVQAEQLELFI